MVENKVIKTIKKLAEEDMVNSIIISLEQKPAIKGIPIKEILAITMQRVVKGIF